MDKQCNPQCISTRPKFQADQNNIDCWIEVLNTPGKIYAKILDNYKGGKYETVHIMNSLACQKVGHIVTLFFKKILTFFIQTYLTTRFGQPSITILAPPSQQLAFSTPKIKMPPSHLSN